MILADKFSKPAIVVIPGSFSIAAMYYPLQDQLQAAGYETYITILPSASRNAPEAPASLEDDVNESTKIIQSLVDKGKSVVVFAHSYGGMVASQLSSDLTEKQRSDSGLQGGIVRLIYLAAIVLPVGQSVIGDQGRPPATVIETDEFGFMRLLHAQASGERMYNNWPEPRATAWAEAAPKQSLISFESPLTSILYKDIPSTYILCEQDAIIPPAKQEQYVRHIEEVVGHMPDVRKIPTGHVPNLTATEILVETVCSILDL